MTRTSAGTGAAEAAGTAAEAQVIRGGHQVDRVAHEVGTHHDPFRQKVFEVVVAEAGQPRPQPGVRHLAGLGLQARQVRDRVAGPPPQALRQQLAVQGGAVELPVGGAERGSLVRGQLGSRPERRRP
jgi:hypothetical protein